MEKDFRKFTATTLRFLLIEESKAFVTGLDYCSTVELYKMKLNIKQNLDLLAEKESEEINAIIWENNSTKTEKADLEYHAARESNN